MKILAIMALALVVGGTGCDPYERLPTPKRYPSLRANTIVVITSKNCMWCNKQKDTLDNMRSELRGVAVRYLSYENQRTRDDYPDVRYFPTVYINSQPLVGYQDHDAILDALND